MRAIVVDPAGAILRTVSGIPSQLHLQAGPGEAVFALTEGDEGQVINDQRLKVSEDGRLVALGGEAAPGIELQYIVTGT
ncbi:hypothetical protein GVN18_39280 [Pseudomonas sp. ODNR1LW]|nr:hypothetical protein [Pseudomonas sp. ODNR1LW]